jgi:hypothetical protein
MLEPNVPYPYAEALLYAELAKDDKAMEWAAGNLVKQEWPMQNQDLHRRATQKVEALRSELERTNRGDEARRLMESVRGQKQRDLKIKLNWQGEADLDLKVQEPSGSVCSSLNRQTVGGGILVGDTLADMNSETYTAGQAFAGEYVITVERFRGRPLADRAQLRIVQHEGTPEETEQLISVDLREGAPVKVRLDKGRRTEAAYVPPPTSRQSPLPASGQNSRRDIQAELRAAADPEVTGFERGFRAGTTSPTAMTDVVARASKDPEPSPGDTAYYQTKVSSFVKNSLDVTAQAVLSADRRHVRVSMTPLTAPGAVADKPVSVSDPVIPGGF